LAFGVANVLEALAEGPHRFYVALGRLRVEETDHWHRRLLRPRRERPGNRRATEQRDEVASPHSITSSASASNLSGSSRPSAVAVPRLITNSNFVDCGTGRSSGFSPLRMRPA